MLIRLENGVRKEMKYCPKCKNKLDANLFYKDTTKKTGLSSYCKPCDAKKRKLYYQNSKDKHNEYCKKQRVSLKYQIMQHYGGKCFCCGESKLEFLAIDHIEGGGNKHRKSINNRGGVQFYYFLRRNNFPTGYRVACHNCNLSMGFYGYCPHSAPLGEIIHEPISTKRIP